MYLKSLEVHGFKSFANKIKFDFHNGITGIVGPNGSGKSNVADAVRWVLGEQRARQLRGANMQDVIFSGTESRKQLSYASVSITLDNSDHQLPIEFAEVTITRRVYRSGESEYMLNGTVCRLKDVNELFYDTGIGKEGYSIIGQGQIDRILNGKPEERRELFDEAAGIVKYKRRKATAQKKLESEQENLVRVNDILGELEKQLVPLEKQSDIAKVYLKKKDDLKEHDVDLFLMETGRIREQLEQVGEKTEIAAAQLEETNASVDAIKSEYERMEREMEEMDERIRYTREKLSETNLYKEKLEGQINVLQEQMKAANLSDEHFKTRLQSLEEDIHTRDSQKEVYGREQEQFGIQLSAMQEKLVKSSANLKNIQAEINGCNEGIENGKNEIIDLLNSKASIKAKLQKFDTMMEQVNIRKAQLNQRLLQKKSDENQMEAVLGGYRQEQKQAEDEIAKKEEAFANMQEKTQEWNKKQRETTVLLEEKSIAFHKEESKYESLRNIAERYDGYGNGIRKVMEKKEEEKGIIGVVADIIKADKKYEVAIETALGGNIQNVVTKDEATAKRLIEHLKSNHLGRATFLPKTSVKAVEDPKLERILGEQGVLGRADTLVHKEKEFEQIISYLLCRVLVVDTIDNALELAKKYRYSFRIVTLEGEALNPGGSLAGGAFRNTSSLLGRNREIEESKGAMAALKTEREQLRNRLQDIRTAAELLEEDKIKLKEAIQQLKIIHNTAVMNVEGAKKQRQESDNLYQGLQLESAEIETQLQVNQHSKEQILIDMEHSEKREKKIEREIKDFQQMLEGKLLEEDKESKVVSSLQMEEASIRQKYEFSQENTKRIRSEIKKLQEEEELLKKNTEQTKEEITKKVNGIEKIKQTILEGNTEFSRLTEKLQICLEQKEEMTSNHRGFFQKREELTGRQTDLDKEIFRLNGQREKLEEALESQTNYMWDEYQLTLHHAMELKGEADISLGELKRLISEVRDEIRKLGDVNVNAIEDYKNLFQRYEFLRGQRDDLVRAEETLNKILEDLDSGMRKQFKEKFAEIQYEFDRAFKELFGGGKGTLELSEGEDILESGIVIIAQPPGKKLQNMMQLSGGEKALTAISLLFAIQNMKPSPFCLLDEIEAALDDSNVGRFAKYLSKLTKNTQFIIITHRRGTMTAADRLYGITMQEKGVSALVSVNLIENDLDK